MKRMVEFLDGIGRVMLVIGMFAWVVVTLAFSSGECRQLDYDNGCGEVD